MGEKVWYQITYFAGIVLEFSEVFWDYSYTLQSNGCSIAGFLEVGFQPVSSMDHPFVCCML